ncbi:MFS-1 multi-domain protein [Pyrenophora tritici-repentis]|nr:MFS-1 multi-domain protein [Pyrenophora tritici-repentis]
MFDDAPFEVAIVGGGIAGLTLAIGLLRRNIPFKIYERAQGFREIGAGIGFTANAERAMLALDPRIHAGFRNLAFRNNEDDFYYVDGYHWDPNNPDHEEVIFKMYLDERGFEGCRRPDFLEELVRHIPPQFVAFGKDLVSVRDDAGDSKCTLSFHDGSAAKADLVIGCDGIRSKLRRVMFGEGHPAAYPQYTYKYAIRGLIPMDQAKAAVGEFQTFNRMMHFGPGAHALTFPVAGGNILNVVAFVTDPDQWKAPDGKLTAPASKAEAAKAFSAFSPVVRKIINLLPDTIDKWAVFDTGIHPPPSYVSGRLCLAGDAAHAAAPHHGAGAGCGIEDTLVLACLLEAVARSNPADRSTAIRSALQVYNNIRYERTQWLVQSSRMIGDVYEFMHPECGQDHQKIAHEIYTRSHKIWDYEVDAMAQDALHQFGSAVKNTPSLTSVGKEADKSSTEVSLVGEKPVEHIYMSGFALAAVMAIPYITDEFNSLLNVGWYGSAYQLVCATLQPLTGTMYARLNSKVLFLTFFTIFMGGSAICGAAQSSVMLILGRAVAGFGAAGIMNGGFTMLNSCVSPQQRPGMLGIMMTFGNLGAAAGPLIGGAITEYATWRWCFYINLPVSAIVFPFLVWLRIPEHIPKPHWKAVLLNARHEFNLIGFSVFAPAAIMLWLVLDFGGNRWEWDSSTTIGLLCGSVATFALFTAWNNHQGDKAMLPFSTLKLRVVWSSCLTILMLAGTLLVLTYYLPLCFQGVRGDTPFLSGVHFLPTAVTQVVLTLISGRLIQVLGYYLPFLLVGGVLGTIGSGLMTLISPSLSLARIIGFQVLAGVGRGIAFPMPMIALENSLPPARIPTAISTFVFCQNLGSALFTIIAQTVFANSLKSKLSEDAPTIDVGAIIRAGSTKMRTLVTSEQLPQLLEAYSSSIRRTFILGTATSIVSLLVSYFMGWKDVRHKRAPVAKT